ncbi:MAG TPA: (5-formylfuran-3-yl)methyl phosphate synthase [Pirellulales bacterium]|jgi:hypothetical protein
MSTGLLVSVRDRHEALYALAAGADLIDLKEPHRGSLGPVDAATMNDVVTAVAGRAPLSAALGELLEAPSTLPLPSGVQLAKFGLSGCASRLDWPELFSAAIARLPASTSAVAVIYADTDRAQAPPPAEVLQVAARSGCRAILVDTWRKDSGGLLDLWSLAECRQHVARVQELGMLAVLAGSLDVQAITTLLPCAPDYVAVRGAACAKERTGPLSLDRVRALVHLVHEQVNDARRNLGRHSASI